MFVFLKRSFSRLGADESGQLAPWVILFSLMLFAMLAFTIDLGFWLVDRRHAQNDADAAVLAGGALLQDKAVDTLPELQAAADEAQDWLERNSRNRQDPATVKSICSLEKAPPEYTFELDGFLFADPRIEGTYEKIRACIRREGFVIFGRLLGLAGIRIPAVAAAGLEVEPLRYALMAMNPDDCDTDGEDSLYLHLSQGGQVNLGPEGSSYTDSPCDAGRYALRLQGQQSDLIGATHDFCGGDFYQGSPDNMTGTPRPGICDVDDPWAGETQPVPGSCRPEPYVSPLDPNLGAYCKALGSGNWVFEPGVHVFRRGMKVTTPASSLTGTGVVLYFTCSTGDQCCPSVGSCANEAGAMEFNGGVIDLAAPADDPHIVIWIDRTSGPPTPAGKAFVQLLGNGALTIDGHIYSWPGQVTLGGTSDGSNRDITGTILADKIEFHGDATYNIIWDEEFAPKRLLLTLVE